MVTTTLSPELEFEEDLVAELERLGIRYLSRLSTTHPTKAHLPSDFIAALSRQPSSRVRAALIPLFLAHPEYAKFVPSAIRRTGPKQTTLIKLFYTAAVLLQMKYANIVRKTISLPDLFSKELGISGSNIEQQLFELGKRHQEISGQFINWQGSYENAARHLFRQWEMEKRWNESLQKP